MLPFLSDFVAIAYIDIADDGVDPLLVSRYGFKINGIADQQGLADAILQVTVRRFDAAVFVSFSPVVACRPLILTKTDPPLFK